MGSVEARQAVADYSSAMGVPVTAQDVILTSGCSQSLEIVISLLANPGQNILIPRPGFPLYTTLAKSIGVETKYYELQPETEWSVDLESLSNSIDEKTAAVIFNNPSNPCGGNFTLEHMRDIIDICYANKIPIVADEVYEHVVYNGARYNSFAEVSKTVPVFAVSSISKRFLVPGWRLGWVLVHDRMGAITHETRQSLIALTQRTLGPSSLLQGALPVILKNAPQSTFDHTNRLLEENAKTFCELLSQMPGLTPIKPSGAMYLMVKIDVECFPDFESDVTFTERLMMEESVFCLPASCFSYPGYFRIVLSVPRDKVEESCERISQFCHRHYLHEVPTPLNQDGNPITYPTKTKSFNRISSSIYLMTDQKEQ
ncbi:tyrosine aminotransferase-like isoform X2 [Watersipora subatra]